MKERAPGNERLTDVGKAYWMGEQGCGTRVREMNGTYGLVIEVMTCEVNNNRTCPVIL